MTGEKVLILSSGLWRLRKEVHHLTGLEPVFGSIMPPRTTAIAGWGHKPTAQRARMLAQKRGVPYIAIEDGFLRSLKSGNDMRSLAYVVDRQGIYYDARGPSDLESLINDGRFTADELARAQSAMAFIREGKLSKYNAAASGALLPRGPYTLVIDQTAGDASIAGGLADTSSFEVMVREAIAASDGGPVVAKLHPETIAGTKGGFLAGLRQDGRVVVVDQSVNPWDLLAEAARVYTVSSQFGFEALMAGKEVHCFGAPFYAGWGLTQDHVDVARRTRRARLAEVFAAAYLRYSHYFDAWTRQPIDIETAIDQLVFLRQGFLGNRTAIVFHRMPRWKQKPLERLLEGPCPPPRHAKDLDQAIQIARTEERAIAAWGKQANAIRARVQTAGVQLVSIEDGFLRSAGLGAAFTPSFSYSFDSKGIYYDPSAKSKLEELLQGYSVDDALLARAQAMRAQIRAHNLSKYNLTGESSLPEMPEGRRRILVIGQVADDEAVRKSLAAPEANVNAMVLEQVRRQSPEALILYKPHPDVERLGRAGAIAESQLNGLCDGVLRNVPIGTALDAVEEVAVFTSLAGFEALIRDKVVRVFGQPFYAGWGLTRDIQAMPRRSRRLSLDELLAITLIVYPRYFDPVSGLPCPPEVAMARLLELKAKPKGFGASLREAAGRSVILWRRIKGT